MVKRRRPQMIIPLVWAATAAMLPTGCRSSGKHDLAKNSFPEKQAEICAALDQLAHDAMSVNLDRLRAGHLDSDKFTKFGARAFARQNIDQCNESEAALFAKVQDLQFRFEDPKIDVFGNVAVMTCYNHVSFVLDGQPQDKVARNTLVFLRTDDGWKIVHEHVTPKACFD